MKNLCKLIWTTIFGRHNERLDGSGLFAGEYTTASQYQKLDYCSNPTIRMPYRRQWAQEFRQSAELANQCGVQVVALLDQFESNDIMLNCLSTIKRDLPFVKHIELFNELPAMQYPGQRIISLEELIIRTNKYSDYIHATMPGVKVLTMAPYNSIDERAFDAWQGVTNTRILKDLVLYTAADITTVHIYGDSISKRLQMLRLADNLKAWNNEAPCKKALWITEIGVDGWGKQVGYYKGMVRMAVNILHPTTILWYRQSIDHAGSPDAAFAMEYRDTGEKSPLWNHLQ